MTVPWETPAGERRFVNVIQTKRNTSFFRGAAGASASGRTK